MALGFQMSELFYESIPEDRRDIARSAISAAFGRAQPTGLEPITHGASGALIYRVEVTGRPYLLRLETRQDALDDRARGYVCMQAAAEAGIAPPLHHADAAAGRTCVTKPLVMKRARFNLTRGFTLLYRKGG